MHKGLTNSSVNSGAVQWKSFFSLLFSDDRDSQTEELIRRWGTAEQTATNYGISIAADRGLYASPAELIFLGVGDVYRGANASGRHVPIYIAAAVGAVIDGVSGTENGMDTMVDLGMALTDPRTLIGGHSPVYYASAVIWENYGHWEWPSWMTGN